MPVSTHICAGNVSTTHCFCRHDAPAFQLIYVRGMFQLSFRFFLRPHLVSTHICARNVSIAVLSGANILPSFNSYMCGECFWPLRLSPHIQRVSTHICAGNVSGKFCPCKMLQYRFNSYMCGECFSWYVYDGVKWALFQLIYMRGMFQVYMEQIM